MNNKVLIEVSNRHVHLTQEDVETLFGPGAVLHHKKELTIPGQFACEERVDVVGPKKTLSSIIILAPTRKASQVEVSLTNAREMGIEVPVRESGDLDGSAPCTLVGPAGKVELKQGLIAAKRHIHLSPKEAEEFNVADREVVGVKIESNGRNAILLDVIVRVDPVFINSMHVDTDEANACGISGEFYGEIVKL